MIFRKSALAAALTVALAGGVTGVSTLSASAATPRCGGHCIDIYSKKLGTADDPRFVETVLHGVARAGQPTVLHRAGGTDPAEDFLPHLAKVSDFHRAGLVSAAVNRHYGNLHAAQIQYAPSGRPSGLCAALATTAYEGEGLTLQPCDLPGRTVWIVDTTDSPSTAAQGLFPLVNGSTRDFVHPFAMTVPEHGRLDGTHARHHTRAHHHPRAQIQVRRLAGDPGHVPDGQLWGTKLGILK
ncbi:hypothetical protein [Streptomyces sp. NPDC001068]|uniref:hypothetical protein n=1 Tax=Streptomyces sp. NPDC001068 TaxID=3364544 RepID=UPI0036A79BA1